MPARRLAPAFLSLALLLLAGCNAWQNRAEFAPPESRWPATLPSPVPADAPPPPIAPQFCYRTLATVDCFNEAKPDRVTGYTGTYPHPDTVPGPRAAAASPAPQNSPAW